MDLDKNPRNSRRGCIVLVVIMITIFVAVAMTIGIYYGLKVSDDEPEPGFQVPLKILSMRSDGLVGDTATVTFTYQASSDHSFTWRFTQPSLNTLTSVGKRRRLMHKGLGMYQCSEDIAVNVSKDAYIFVNSGNEQIHMVFNLTTLKSVWTYDIPELQNTFVDFNSTVVAPETGNLHVYVSVKLKNLSSNNDGHGLHARFRYLNTSGNPPFIEDESIINISAVDPDSLPETFNTTGAAMNISLKNTFAKFGGILSIELPEYADPRFLQLMTYERWIEVFRADTHAVIPEGVLGFYKMESTFPFYGGEAFTVTCFAMGNPMTSVKIFRELPGKSTLVQSDTTLHSRWSRMEVKTLHNRKEVGNYTCRATSGSQTATYAMEVFAAEITKISESQSRVVENSPEKTVVKCTATGFPVPELMFSNGCHYHYDAVYTEGNNIKFDLVESNSTASLVMTISPPDANISSVCCLATDHLKKYGPRSTFSIPLSPDETSAIP